MIWHKMHQLYEDICLGYVKDVLICFMNTLEDKMSKNNLKGK